MLKVNSNAPTSQLSVYAGRKDATHYTVLVINKTAQSHQVGVRFSDSRSVTGGRADVIRAASLGAMSVTFNNQTSIPNNLGTVAPLSLPLTSGNVNYTFPPYSITLLTMTTP